MTRKSQTHSGRGRRFALFLLFACFIHDRMTLRRFRMEAFGASERFSAWLARMGRCPNLQQNGGHHPPNLPRGDRTPFGFPRQQRVESQRACQIQLSERQHHDPTPQQKLARRAHVDAGPEQILLQKAKTMFFREAQAIAFGNLFQRHQIIEREKPTDAGIALGVASRGALDADHAQHEISILLEMHPRTND